MDDRNRELLVKERNKVREDLDFCVKQQKQLASNYQADAALYAKSHALFNSLLVYWKQDVKLHSMFQAMEDQNIENERYMRTFHDKKQREVAKNIQELRVREEELQAKLRRK